MSDRKQPHNGRDTSGQFKVKQADVDELSPEFIRDDVRLGGAIEDTGAHAGERGQHIGDLVEGNREDVERATGTNDDTER